MANQQSNAATSGNGTTPEAKKTSILDAAKAVHEARDHKKNPVKPAELKAALEAYFKIDDEMKQLTEKLEAQSKKRTKATLEIVELRGTGRLDTKSRGTGQITARGTGAWILFMGSTGDTIDA